MCIVRTIILRLEFQTLSRGKYSYMYMFKVLLCLTSHVYTSDLVDGSWSNWQSWSKCSVTCANGTQTRARQCDFDPRYPKGSNCSGIDNETKSCDQGQCPGEVLPSSSHFIDSIALNKIANCPLIFYLYFGSYKAF